MFERLMDTFLVFQGAAVVHRGVETRLTPEEGACRT